ncbi:MAG: Clp protease N-terminal domain-containing protein, partial [Candidatus Sulfotelmatobacter sp.]
WQMFERYTEKARRVIFFARYEASQYGSPEIDTEHLLLGLIRENKALHRWLPKTNPLTIRQRVDEEHSPKHPSIPTTVDLPLSDAAKRVLKHAMAEADGLSHKHIGTEHLFLGLLDEEGCFAAELLLEGGADAASIRRQLTPEAERHSMPGIYETIRTRNFGRSGGAILIHGIPRSADRIHDAVQRCRLYWHWDKRAWTNLDIVVAKKTGKFSFDLRLATDKENFELVKGGWKKDHCFICGWELFESQDDADHGTGYTNGHDWLCTECYTKFWQRPDFFSSSYSDIT